MQSKDFKTYRISCIQSNINKIGVSPLDIMLTGVTGAGKSSTINKIFNQDGLAKVGVGVDPETMDLTHYSLNNKMRFWDTPGLGDGVQKDREHSKRLIELLNRTYEKNGSSYGFIDLVVVVIEGLNRDMGTTYKLLNEIIVPNIQSERVLVVINQCDVAMKGRGWIENEPNSELLEFLHNQTLSIQRRVLEATGCNIPKPIFYSAECGYNLEVLYDFIIDHMPISRREMLR